MHPSKTIISFFIFCIVLSTTQSLKAEGSCSDRDFDAPKFPNGLSNLEQALARDLELINYPPYPWRIEEDRDPNDPILDVAIIGAGMAGLTTGVALFKEGISNIKLFDQTPKGKEGPWVTYGRMKTLRSNKADMGLALDIPHLTFQAWFEAQYPVEDWEKLCRIPNRLWMDYLNWYREVMKLPIENECQLISLVPYKDHFVLVFDQQDKPITIKTRKVVLATGRGGFGGPQIPAFARHLPKSVCAHVIDPIDFEDLKNKNVSILGAGSSAFDAAAVALETGAKQVDLFMREDRLPCVNKLACLPDQCLRLNYYAMRDQWRWTLMTQALSMTVPPPIDSLKRVCNYPNFQIKPNKTILEAKVLDGKILLETNQGAFLYDFLILGTGYAIEGNQQQELKHMIDYIKLWEDHLSGDLIRPYPAFGRFPYLGPSFEFMEKDPGTAPYLKNIYCFNYGAIMSHGLLSNDISSMSFGAVRLAAGISADFLLETCGLYLKQMENYEEKVFDQDVDCLFNKERN